MVPAEMGGVRPITRLGGDSLDLSIPDPELSEWL